MYTFFVVKERHEERQKQVLYKKYVGGETKKQPKS